MSSQTMVAHGRGTEADGPNQKLEPAAIVLRCCIGILNHLFFWPEQYRRTGGMSNYLNQCWGVPVFGVDRSPEMLTVATRNCPKPNICFLQQDIRCLRLPYPVDLITANFDTMNHLLTGPDL
jgi:ubiquinone/menaquinone biosynthesis C-methylase UbiE